MSERLPVPRAIRCVSRDHPQEKLLRPDRWAALGVDRERRKPCTPLLTRKPNLLTAVQKPSPPRSKRPAQQYKECLLLRCSKRFLLLILKRDAQFHVPFQTLCRELLRAV